MNYKIEAWVQRANDIATHIAELQARVAMYDTETLHNAWKEQKAALDTHLRTTPEGYCLVKANPGRADIEYMAIAKGLIANGDILHESWVQLLKPQWDAVVAASQKKN